MTASFASLSTEVDRLLEVADAYTLVGPDWEDSPANWAWDPRSYCFFDLAYTAGNTTMSGVWQNYSTGLTQDF